MHSDVSSFSFLQYLTTVLDNIGDSVLLISIEPDERFKLLITNKRFGRSSGYPSDSVGKYIDEIVSPDSYDKIVRRYKEAIRHKQPLSYSEWVDVPVGRRAYEVKMIPILDSVGECKQLVVITREISGVILTNQQLKQAKRFLRASTPLLGDVVWLIDEEGVIHYDHSPGLTSLVNKRYSNIPGLPELPKTDSTTSGMVHDINGLAGPWDYQLRHSAGEQCFIFTARKQA